MRQFLKITILDGEVATSCVKQLKLQPRRTFRFNAARGPFIVAKCSCSSFFLFLSLFWIVVLLLFLLEWHLIKGILFLFFKSKAGSVCWGYFCFLLSFVPADPPSEPGAHIHAFHLYLVYFKQNLSLGVWLGLFNNFKEMCKVLELSNGEYRCLIINWAFSGTMRLVFGSCVTQVHAEVCGALKCCAGSW